MSEPIPVTRPPRRRVVHPHSDEMRTKQDDRNRTNLNSIMRKYMATGELPTGRPVSYGDFTKVDSLLTAMVQVDQAERSFARLPAKVRDLCANDPVNFLAMVETEEGRQALNDAGMKPEQDPTIAEQVVAGIKEALTPTPDPSEASDPPAGQAGSPAEAGTAEGGAEGD